MNTKEISYYFARSLGMFYVSNLLTQRSLRILCYHGLSIADEHRFRPQLFMTAELFHKRMVYLKKKGYRTLSLDTAILKLQRGTLLDKEIVITIDDGFHSVHTIAAPILEELGFSATVYVTTYYVINNNPIFRLALQYLFWKTKKDKVPLKDFIAELPKIISLKGADRDKAQALIIEHGEKNLNESGRMELLQSLADRLDINFGELVFSRRLTLMSPTQITNLSQRGFDIQLHTHRHFLPEKAADIQREINDNILALQPLTSNKQRHFCYPSGAWSPRHWASLTTMNITTATTCDTGLNHAQTPQLALLRFLDFQNTPQIVFEAYLAGFSDYLRKFRSITIHKHF